MLTFKIRVVEKTEDQTFYQGILSLNNTPIMYGDPFNDWKMCYTQMMQMAYTMISDLRRISDDCFDHIDKED